MKLGAADYAMLALALALLLTVGVRVAGIIDTSAPPGDA